ncbi:MAG: transporter [Paenibacillus sp.]|nr:transporter [Paenibacillus sp.]
MLRLVHFLLGQVIDRLFHIPDWLRFFVKQFGRSKAALLLVTLLTMTAAVCGAAAPLLIGRLIDRITLYGGEGSSMLSLLLLGTLLVTELSVTLRAYVSSKTMIRLSYQLTGETLAAVLRASSGFFTSTPRGELLQRCIQDTKAVQQFGLSTLPGFVQELVLAGVAVGVIASWNWPLAVVLLAAYFLLFIPVHVYGKKRGAARQQLVIHEARLRHNLLEKLETVKQIKLYGTERKEHEAVLAEQERWGDLKYQEGILDNVYRMFPRIPDSLAPALIFLFAGWQMIHGQASVGQLVTIIAYIPAINAPVRSFFGLYVSFADIKVRIHGLLDYLRLPVEPGLQDGLLRLSDCRHLPVSFSGVSVTADRGDLLRHVSFTIAPGEHIAIVGPTGAGKSTLLRLLLRLQEPAAGHIRIGGFAISELNASCLRSRIGYVMQEGTWFKDSLYNNLTYLGETDHDTLDGWIRAFGADSIVAGLEAGYDTDIGQNGGRLSGGQRQLMSLVRTMIKQPDILLLDEATSSLDPISESLVYQALDIHAAGITRVSVTHRLRGAALADRILVLDRGQLVEQGSHEQLLRLQGLYAKLWREELEQGDGEDGSAETKPAEAKAEGGVRHEHRLAPVVR